MMQFTENPLTVFHQISPLLQNTTSNMINNNNINPPWPHPPPLPPPPHVFPFPMSKPGLSGNNNRNVGDASCMEQLLVHCANALETNDATLAQQIIWVLNNIAPSDGDSNQRLTCAFLRALIARAAKTGSCTMLAGPASEIASPHSNLTIDTHRFSVIELANFVDLTPWHRFGFTAANSAILEAVEGYSVIHIVDLSLTHCMQIPTLLDAISNRLEGPPLVKLTVASGGESEDLLLPPILDISYDELGLKLVNFARSRNVVLEFRVIGSSYSDGYSCLLDQLHLDHQQQSLIYSSETRNHEALVVNCHMMLHYIPDETLTRTNIDTISVRDMFLKEIRGLDPTVVVLVDEDSDLRSDSLVCRLRSAFNYLWIPYDSVDTFLGKGSKERQWYEANIGWKIENIISHEGVQRIERVEPKNRWVDRMRKAGFRGVCFGEDAVSEVRSMLDEHAAGWGLKKEEDEHLVLTWKGHNVVFATLWVSA